MQDTPAPALGPAPFCFSPSQPVLDAPAFSWPFKALASAIAFGAALWLALLWRGGTGAPALGSAALSWFAAAVALLLWTWWHVLRGHTTLDAQALRQSWIWEKRMPLGELAYCKLIRVRGLDWLIAPRLYARNLAGKFAVFYAADAALLRDLERLARELAEFRRM